MLFRSIAQSMGGLNVRQFYKNRYTQTGQKAYGGLITTGTPHAGSRAAENIDNGELINFCNSAYSNITEGARHDPLMQAAGALGNLSGSYALTTLGNIPPSINDFIDDYPGTVTDYFTNNFFGSTQAKNDLKTTSPKISDLRNYNMNIPVIAIYGEEEYPAALRNVYSKALNQATNFNLPVGGIDNDNLAPEVANSLKSFMYNVSDAYYAASIISFASAWWLPVLGITGGVICANSSTHWSHSAAYMNGPFQRGLEFVIGSTVEVSSCYQTRVWTCGYGDNAKVIPLPDDNCWQTVYVDFTYLAPTPGDGVVPRESAMCLTGVGNAKYKADKVNHEQLRNSMEMERIFKDIFNGTKTASSPNPGFFITPTR